MCGISFLYTNMISRQYRRVIGLCLLAGLLFLGGCALVAKFYPNSDKVYARSMVHAPFDVIIVPGVPFDGNSWSDVMKLRVYYSLHLYNRGIAKNIIYSGSAVYSPYYEGRIMALYGAALGIPTEHIFEEIEAEHSTENLYYSYKIALKHGFKKIALATDPFQTNMIRRFRKKHKLPIALLPLNFDTMSTYDKIEPVLDPSSAYDSSFVSLLNRESLLERLNGTRGKNIDFNKN